MITLREITSDDMFDECLELKVKKEQREHCASNTHSLAEAWLSYSTYRPFCIYKDETMVGFVMLDCDEAEKECGIWRIMIDEKYQGKGYGKEAMKIVLEDIKKNLVFEDIFLYVKPDNEIAIKIYKDLGFYIEGEIGEYVDGEYLMLLGRA